MSDDYRVNQRAVAYIRVSKEREEMVSPELQMAAIEAHCRKRGFTIVKTLEDLDMSGRFWKRRTVEQGIAMIEAREAEALVVWKISRVARNRKDWAIALDRVESIGGKLESAMEPVDTSTSSGRFTRGMMAEMAVYESEQIGDSWKAAHSRRNRLGLPHSGKARFGYDYSKDTGYSPNDDSKIMRQLYRMYNQGKSFRQLFAYLTDEGYDVPGMREVTSLRRSMDLGFAAGYFVAQGELVKGAHEPIITEGEWAEYQARRKQRGSRPRAEASDYAYSGLLRCFCGGGMHGGVITAASGKKFRRYTCDRSVQRLAHPATSISEAQVEAAVHQWLEGVAAEIDERAKKISVEPVGVNLAAKAKQLDAEISKTLKRLDNLAIKSLDGDIPQDQYKRLKEQFDSDLEALRARKRMLEVNAQVQPRAVVPQLLVQWPNLPARGKKEILFRLVKEIKLYDWPDGVRKGSRPLKVRGIWE